MTQKRFIEGAKGKGGGNFSESPDSLKTTQYAKIIDLLCEGEIEGIVGGERGIYLNDTPLVNPDGSWNFKGISFDTVKGTPNQKVLSMGTSVSNTVSVGTRVLNGTPIDHTIIDSSVDYVTVGIGIPQLTQTDSSNGNIYGTSVQYSIELYDSTGAKQDLGLTNISSVRGDMSSFKTPLGCSKVKFYADVTSASSVSEIEYSEKGRTRTVWSSNPTTFSFQLSSNGGTTWNTITATTIRGSSPMECVATVSPNTSYLVRIVATGGYTVGDKPATTAINGVSFLGVGGTVTISGKCSSQYVSQHMLKLVGKAPWKVRVTRITPNSTSSLLVNDIYLSYVNYIYLDKLNYPYCALVGMTIDATQFSSIPTRKYDTKLLKVKVPTNYDPISRTYTGIWDGSFKVAWTDNPAWCFYDLLTNSRYGLGERISAASVDKFALYSIAKYCDELVFDGFGGKEPRFTCNILLKGQDEAFKVINDFVSIFRGMVYWSQGGIFAVQDSPKTPSYLFTNANVEEGLFTYTSTPMNTRYNVAMVSWADQNNLGNPQIEYVSNDDDIAKYGFVNSTNIVAVGCTSRGQARRIGKWLLYTNSLETDSVEFTVGLEGNIPLPGDVIKISDKLRAGIKRGGRLLGFDSATSTFQLDSPMDFIDGKVYKISFVNSLGKMDEGTLVNFSGQTATIANTVPPAYLPVKDSPYIITSSDVEAALFRVVNISDKGEGKFTILAVSYNATKYKYIENGESLEKLSTSVLSPVPSSPSNVVVSDDIFMNNMKVLISRIQVKWDSVPNVRGYLVTYRFEDGNWMALPETQGTQGTIDNVADGKKYYVRVQSINNIGVKSAETQTVEYTPLGKTKPPADISSAMASVTNSGVLLKWSAVADVDLDFYEVRKGDSWSAATLVSKVYADSLNMGTIPSGRYLVKAVDNTGNYSVNAAVIDVSVQTLTAPVVSNVFTGPVVNLSWTPSTGTYLLSHYVVDVSGKGSYKVNGTALTVPANWTGTTRVTVTPYDIAGNAGTSGILDIPIAAPAAPVVSQSFQGTNVVFTWPAVTSTLQVQYYKVTVGGVVTTVNATTHTYAVNFSGSRVFSFKTVDVYGNESADAQVTVTVSAPSQPSISQQLIGNQVVLNWTTSPGTLPISSYLVSDSAGNSSKMDATVYAKAIDWSGNRTFTVIAYDAAGNQSPSASIVTAITLPPAVTSSYSVSGSQVTLNWNAVNGALATSHYVVTVDSVATVVKATTYSVDNKWTGTKTFTIQAVDVAGNTGTAANLNVQLSISPAPSLNSNIANNTLTLSWSAVQGSFQTDKYLVTTVGFSVDVKGTSTSIPVNWVGDKTFTVTPYDIKGSAGTPSTLTVTVTAPPTPTVTAKVDGQNYTLKWENVQGSLSTAFYEIYKNDVYVTRIQGLSYSAGIDFVTATFKVKAIDANENASLPGMATVAINKPAAPTLTAQVVDNNVLLKWSDATATLPIKHYQIRKGSDWDTAVVVGTVQGTFTSVFETTSGTFTYQIAGIDTAGNYGAIGKISASVNQPPDYVLNYDYNASMQSGFSKNSIFDRETSSFYLPFVTNTQIGGYSAAGSADSSVLVYGKGPDGKVQTLLKTVTLPTGDAQGGWNSPNDLAIDTSKTYVFTIPVYVDESNAALQSYWGLNWSTVCNLNTTTLNTNPYFANGTIPRRKWYLMVGYVFPAGSTGNTNDGAGIYDMETGVKYASGTNFTWSASVTSTGTRAYSYYPGNTEPTAYFAEPKATQVSSVLTAYSDILAVKNTLLKSSPWSHIESYLEHFTKRSWASPQAQVNAGFPYVLEPTGSSGSYWEVIDFGTVIASTKISVTPTVTVIHGSPTYQINIYTKANLSDTWKVFSNTSSVYASGFRYCKVEFVVTSSNEASFLQISGFNLRLDKKLLSDAGSVLALATDTNGTPVTFNQSFVDVISINLSANKQTAVIPVYSFSDVPNPTGFNVLLYDLQGNRTSGEVSWGAKGV